MVEQAIETCKAEQANINSSIQLYTEILQALTPQTKTGSEESDGADAAATDADTSPEDKDDIELLERALQKALRVRTGTGASKKDSNKQSAPGSAVVTSKEGIQACSAPKGNHTTTRSTSKSAGLDRKDRKKSGGIVHHQRAGKSQQGVSSSGSRDLGHSHASALLSKNKTVRGGVLGGDDSGKAAAISRPSLNNTVPAPHAEECGAHGLPQQNGTATDQTAKWRSLRRKQNRLWDKVAALQRKPVPGRSHFMERMRATFPEDWPPCGSPDQTRALVGRLTHRGHDLIQQCQTKELLAKHAPEPAAELDNKGNKYDVCLTPERLQTTAAELRKFAEGVKREWEAWDRWRPEGGCLCPTGANGVWGDGMNAPLPPTVTYTTEAELRELETLRMRVALLQQECYIEQALMDALTPQLSSIAPGPGCPGVSVLRDLYSLLGEGGQRFPAVVLDSEPE